MQTLRPPAALLHIYKVSSLARTFIGTCIPLLVAHQLTGQVLPVDRVNPLVGTAKEGQTYPAVGFPFAMTSWTPQTRAGEIKCVAPYYYTDPKIQGFRGSHFLSGSCVPDYGSFTLMPLQGNLKTLPAERASTFERSTEQATPYAYSVNLRSYGIEAELTGKIRSGIMRFTFGKAGPASLVIENNARGGDGWVHVDLKTYEVTGEVPVRREYAGSGKLAGLSSYFVIQFNKNFRSAGTWVGDHTVEGRMQQNGDGAAPGVVRFPSSTSNTPRTDSPRPGFGAYVEFGDVPAGDVLLVRIGTSFVSLDEARKNLRAEIHEWDYDEVKAEAKQAWEHSLEDIRIHDDFPATKVFYTAMYHALLQPRILSDVDGSYPGFAGEGKVEHATDFTYYDDFSMWDIFRAQLPLLTIIEPDRDIYMVKSLLAKGKEGGFLPIYPAWNSYTSEMIGDHAAVSIIDAYTKGLRGFNADQAYRLIRQNAMSLPKDRSQLLDGQGRRGLDSYLKYGYIPVEDHVLDGFAPHTEEQVSRTLEYAYDDAMIAEFAKAMGKLRDADLFHVRGQNWRNAIDPATGFARGRHTDGTWVTPFDPAGNYRWITEGLPWQYTFFVPQDVPGLIALEGGSNAFVARLDGLFTGNFYDHGNEPSHHIAYLYDAAGAAWKTQQHVRSLMENQYKNAPDGLAGNDDAGQMSAWYILSALGFYQVAPGIPEFWLGSPRFDHAEIKLPHGRSLKIEADGASAGKVYVRHVYLNGKLITGYKLSYRQIVGGGVLRFKMNDAPAAQQ